MSIRKNIYLIGPMGSGKTSVGKQLARKLKAGFVDTDEEIERRTGVSVAWIFEKEKEAGFRKREQDAIAQLVHRKNLILATGGGTILSKKNRDLLQSTGTVIYLTVSLNQQLKRTNHRKGKRPLLNQPNPEKKLKELNEQREPVYQAIANIEVNTDGLTPFEVAEYIISVLKNY